MVAEKSRSAPVQLSSGTLSFVLCFAEWGLISSFAPRFREVLHLTATQTAFPIAVPIILGALACIPLGMFEAYWHALADPSTADWSNA